MSAQYNINLQADSSVNFPIRANGGTLYLVNFNAVTTTGDRTLSSLPLGAGITFTTGVSVTGGTWSTPATAKGSIIEVNHGGVIDATNYSQMYSLMFRESCSDSTFTFNIKDEEVVLVQITNLASGTTFVNLNFTEEIPEIH